MTILQGGPTWKLIRWSVKMVCLALGNNVTMATIQSVSRQFDQDEGL